MEEEPSELEKRLMELYKRRELGESVPRPMDLIKQYADNKGVGVRDQKVLDMQRRAYDRGKAEAERSKAVADDSAAPVGLGCSSCYKIAGDNLNCPIHNPL